ncbi:DUF4129 domain-containing protein [Prevotella melaninogenica]|uniref:DUF4129 domain-containing protein n=1 Tax=Prevotella melaninogenica TaxID=28132 RepID=UPI001C5E7AE2|nr:DUF4129 domain-containing protein [Prevotella melaninogenica]MBW4741302.1 DUF4129 domain-containing protein [Prevotella melaninogenica]MBW4913168.1 DUF4129 domain-containing protein [Prevotella melaninogenica]
MLQPLSDTLSCDSSLLHQYRADEAYNYARELQAPELDWWDWLMSKIGEFLSDLFSIQGKGDFRIVIYIVIALAFIALIAFILYRYHFKLFGRAGKVTNENDEEDNIYGVDFEAVYAKAMAQKDYYKAVRIVYLRTLRWLSDGNKISWQLYKTPTQYTREYLSVEFERMTTAFMRVRYGNYQASEELVGLLIDLESKIKKGGEE